MAILEASMLCHGGPRTIEEGGAEEAKEENE
jgi:hypothetical protein